MSATKPRARRRQDLADVVELINAGADVRRVRRYLEQYAGDLDETANQERDS